jgi:hypothetical protein
MVRGPLVEAFSLRKQQRNLYSTSWFLNNESMSFRPAMPAHSTMRARQGIWTVQAESSGTQNKFFP